MDLIKMRDLNKSVKTEVEQKQEEAVLCKMDTEVGQLDKQVHQLTSRVDNTARSNQRKEDIIVQIEKRIADADSTTALYAADKVMHRCWLWSIILPCMVDLFVHNCNWHNCDKSHRREMN